MLNFILNFIFPPLCGICGKNSKEYLCKKCSLKLERLKVKNIENVLLVGSQEKIFNELMYIYKYEGLIRNLILDYKFNDKSYLYKIFSKIILKDEKICRFLKSYDIIIPVSMNRKKKSLRGYNQTELIVKELERNLSIYAQYDNLIKVKNTKSQSSLNKYQRLENLKGAYILKNREIINKRKILVFDDIYTTRKYCSRN